MSDTPLFSVVTICFNAQNTIQDTINSVAYQKSVMLEHIIIDGGSSDNTMKIVNSQIEKFSVVISEADKGIYDAMQKGLMQAKGVFTGFLNADDYFASEDALLKLSRPLMDPSTNIIGLTGALDQVNEKGTITRKIGQKAFSKKDLKWGKMPPHPATYFKTDLMKKTGGFDKSYRIAGDFDMFLKMLEQMNDYEHAEISHVAETVVKMRIGGISTGGYRTYFEIGRENARALKNYGYFVNPLLIQLRGLRKILEIIT